MRAHADPSNELLRVCSNRLFDVANTWVARVLLSEVTFQSLLIAIDVITFVDGTEPRVLVLTWDQQSHKSERKAGQSGVEDKLALMTDEYWKTRVG